LLAYILENEHGGKGIGLVEKLVQRIEEEQEEDWLRSIISEIVIRGGYGTADMNGFKYRTFLCF